ncbi:hypothetical protein [Bacillus alkalicellulosilyticus]|uniref:hypothetical protein n=1 Tax=Alkalihalobacterium alkalicellulosilyticum TaxID=1912214 RepID=UPI0009974912|nr:hypothetical protein [Bacillus alkalicellulosilyticus]
MKKQYTANESKTFWLILLLIAISNLFFLNERIAIIPILFVIIVVAALFLRYELIMEDEKLTLHMKLLNKTIITRKTEPSNIKEMFVITLPTGPGVLLKLNKGLRWRLSKFKPESFIEDFESYASKYEIKLIEIKRNKKPK